MAADDVRNQAFQVAVSVRPHYPPCDFPDHDCGCGAAQDRYAITDALLAYAREAAGKAQRDAASYLEEESRRSYGRHGRCRANALLDAADVLHPRAEAADGGTTT